MFANFDVPGPTPNPSPGSGRVGRGRERRKSNERVHISAGAVVVRPGKSGCEVLVLYRKASNSWHLPKGTKRADESILETALREVKEETGAEILVREYLGSLASVKTNGTPKLTHYYLASPSSVDFSNHDTEHDEVKFVTFGEAYRLLRKKSVHEKEYELFDRYLR
ncbi:MAG: NUDIX domain-containing protein [Patescibacteria group bacterium]|nr:NUDIX domain-containing protein [Patescibacteria group bacterium]